LFVRIAGNLQKENRELALIFRISQIVRALYLVCNCFNVNKISGSPEAGEV
jgi:hypothetical protein